MPKRCEIVCVGKQRNGRPRYWCLAHKANATGKHGVRLKSCEGSNEILLQQSEILTINPIEYNGGIAVWGAVAPVYSTAMHDEPEIGVHVHARRQAKKKKHVDMTYKLVRIRAPDNFAGPDYIEVGQREAVQFLIAAVFEQTNTYIVCPRCGSPHLDEDWFSVNPHRKHLCFGCGREFLQKSAGIGNPLVGVQEQFDCGDKKREQVSANRKLDVRQADFDCGIELWGSNPAILWTSAASEECGVHFHGYTDNFAIPEIDETYDDVFIDDLEIKVDQIRLLMAQQYLSQLEGRIVSLCCPRCGVPHFDRGTNAYTPHSVHHCECGAEFNTPGRKKLVVSNPIVSTLKVLERQAPLERKIFSLTAARY